MRTLLSTAGGELETSFRTWNETIVERIAPVELTPLGSRPFRGTLEAAEIGPLVVSRITQSAIRTQATPDTIRRGDRPDTLAVCIVLDGMVTSLQDDREAVQRAGEIVVLDRRPTVMETQADSRSLVLEVPRARLERMLGSARAYAALTVGADQPSASIVTTFFNELIRVHGTLGVDTAERMASVGLDLIAAGIAERLARNVPKPLHGTILVQRAKAYVEAHLGDPTLDPPQLAAAMGVSLRRLQALFHERGRHISDWIWQRRLAVAAERLADPGYGHLPVGTLAHGCGFANQAHFSRRFKDRYGMTPSEYRQGAWRLAR